MRAALVRLRKASCPSCRRILRPQDTCVVLVGSGKETICTTTSATCIKAQLSGSPVSGLSHRPGAGPAKRHRRGCGQQSGLEHAPAVLWPGANDHRPAEGRLGTAQGRRNSARRPDRQAPGDLAAGGVNCSSAFPPTSRFLTTAIPVMRSTYGSKGTLPMLLKMAPPPAQPAGLHQSPGQCAARPALWKTPCVFYVRYPGP